MITEGDRMPVRKPLNYGIWVFTIGIILLNLYYYYPVYTGTYPNMDLIFSFTLLGVLFWVDIVLTVILIIAATYGFYYRRRWARWYVIFYLLYVSFWAIFSMFVIKWQVFEHYIYLIFYVVFLVYFNLSFVREYFQDGEKEKPRFFTYNGYILHKKEIETKSGKKRIFYFFSKNITTRGIPCRKPEGYLVLINEKSGVPYLKKEE